MNIFYLDEDIKQCAKFHFDKHVVKMILESVQILCTVVNETGGVSPYRSTHKKHPCVIWASESLDNWRWLKAFTLALNEEFQYRFNHASPHKACLVLNTLEEPRIPAKNITERPQVMPDQFKIKGNPVKAYRDYYLSEKKKLLKYTRRSLPEWLNCPESTSLQLK